MKTPVRLTCGVLAAIAFFNEGQAAVYAQARSRPLALAIARSADRLALDPRIESAADDWSRLRSVAPGSDVTLTRRGSTAVPRILVRVGDDHIVLLNLTDPQLPAAASRALRRVAAEHAEYLTAASGNTFFFDGMRLTEDGLYAGSNRIADPQRVVETIARSEVVEVAIERRGRGFWGHIGPLGGFFVGGMAGGFTIGATCQAINGTDRCDSGAFLAGGFYGGIAGGAYGLYAARRRSNEVVYRAP